MMHEILFDSKENPDGALVGLACGHISRNRIEFLQQRIAVTVEARTGQVEFFDPEGKALLAAKVDLPGGDERFSEVRCSAEADEILLGFPRYSYQDNYPHCDGEHDRWTKTISGYRFLRYDLRSNTLTEK